MPRKEIDYSKCIIYKIVCNDLNVKDLYVGSTTDFTKRKSQHKLNCKNVRDSLYNVKVYNMIRENGGWDNWSMIEIEKFPCSDNNEARARERYWLETLNAKLNTNIPIRTREEYREDNKDKLKEYREAKKNGTFVSKKDKLKEYYKNYYKNYYEANQDKMLEYFLKKTLKI